MPQMEEDDADWRKGFWAVVPIFLVFLCGFSAPSAVQFLEKRISPPAALKDAEDAERKKGILVSVLSAFIWSYLRPSAFRFLLRPGISTQISPMEEDDADRKEEKNFSLFFPSVSLSLLCASAVNNLRNFLFPSYLRQSAYSVAICVPFSLFRPSTSRNFNTIFLRLPLRLLGVLCG